MLTIRALDKTYAGRIQALKGVDLDVPSGMFGLLGPNGAGKTPSRAPPGNGTT